MPLFSEMCNPELHIPFPVIPHWPDLNVMPPQMQGKLGDAVLCWVARCPARTWSDITKRKKGNEYRGQLALASAFPEAPSLL